MIYEICNPSDYYTADCPDLVIAALVCELLGNGQYGMRLESTGDLQVPIFLGGGRDDWFREKFGDEAQVIYDKCVATRLEELADALESVLIGKRETFEGLAPPDGELRREFRAKWHDEHRSSMNDIGARAYAKANSLRSEVEAESGVRS